MTWRRMSQDRGKRKPQRSGGHARGEMVFADTRPRVNALPRVMRVEDIEPRVPFLRDMQVVLLKLRALGAAEPELFKGLRPFLCPMGEGLELFAEFTPRCRQRVAIARRFDQRGFAQIAKAGIEHTGR